MNEKTKYEAGFGSDAVKDPQRIVFITKKSSAKVKGAKPPQLMSYPHVLLREVIAFEIFTVALVVVALFWDAPLEQLANPFLTPNPAKAPWYFLGLQELLHYLPPVVAGVLIPTLVVVALVVIPYFDVNIKGEPLWTGNRPRRLMAFMAGVAVLLVVFGSHEAFDVVGPTLAFASLALAAYFVPPRGGRLMHYLGTRPLSWWIMSWFIATSLTLTLVGTLFRGPGWSLVWPWS
jgi:menaquinol-cytochrome c reductase cytochrome b/c subunit